MQRTKHSGVGYEDVRYAYVVIRRGPRPARVETSVGRIGEIGRRALAKERSITPKKLLELYPGNEATVSPSPVVEELSLQPRDSDEEISVDELQALLRKEAYSWPRLVFPPLKKPGHIILDACTAEGMLLLTSRRHV